MCAVVAVQGCVWMCMDVNGCALLQALLCVRTTPVRPSMAQSVYVCLDSRVIRTELWAHIMSRLSSGSLEWMCFVIIAKMRVFYGSAITQRQIEIGLNSSHCDFGSLTHSRNATLYPIQHWFSALLFIARFVRLWCESCHHCSALLFLCFACALRLSTGASAQPIAL